MSESQVDLGFLDKCQPWLLVNTFFPSKVGGRPAWLDVESIPTNDRLKCSQCEKPLTFLCQVYAPLDEYEICFHRMLYVFICTDSLCWKLNISKTIKVFRCQLSKENKYYKATPPNEDVPADEVIGSVKLCQVCGCRGPLSCGACKSVNYCSKEHQKIDWTLGEHKTMCEKDAKPSIMKNNNEKHKYLLEEFDLVTEPEEISDSDDAESEQEQEARRMKDYEEFINMHKEQTKDDVLANVPDEEFEQYTNQIDDDKDFHKFKKRIASDPEQVIRFDRGGKPLWITSKSQPKISDVSACELCKAPRIFEFQIMPQLLNSYKELNVDWGVLAIYTCKQSCDTNGSYVEEYCYKQDICENEQQ